MLLVFAVAFFLAPQIFEKAREGVNEDVNLYFGTFLVSCAVIVMVLVLWEEFLFPIRVNVEEGEVVFRNHRSKLKKQLLIYCAIPAIFVFIYFTYEVNLIRFLIWASICMIMPVAGKLISGIKNYNDFLKLTDDTIEYKNNEKEGVFELKNVQQIILIKDARTVLHKIQLVLSDNSKVLIDLDEMELADFIKSIEEFITKHHYKNVVTSTSN